MVGDINRDGNLDLLVQGAVLLGKGDGTFVAGPDHWQSWDDLLGDFAGDGSWIYSRCQPRLANDSG